jgi:hypothetical protein
MQTKPLVALKPQTEGEITPSFYKSGPKKTRSCSDILCLILFLLLLISAATTTGLAVWYGNPYLIFNGFDSQGKLDNGLEKYYELKFKAK